MLTALMEKAKSRRRRSRHRIEEIPLCHSSAGPGNKQRRISGAECEINDEHLAPSLHNEETFSTMHLGCLLPDTPQVSVFGSVERVSEHNNLVESVVFDMSDAREEDDSEHEPDEITDAQNAEICLHQQSNGQSNSRMMNDHGVLLSEQKSLNLFNWQVIWALLMTKGTRRLTKDQYESMRNFSNAFSGFQGLSWKTDFLKDSTEAELFARHSVLPHYSTLRRTFKPFLLRSLAPRSEDKSHDVDMSKAGARCNSVTSAGDPCASVRVIPPSEYAREDMATPAVWERIKSTSLSAFRSAGSPWTPYSNCVDICPVVAGRRWFYGPQTAMDIDVCDHIDENTDPGRHAFAEHGDTVEAHLIDHDTIEESLQRCFSVASSENGVTKLRGVVSHSWTVHHESRRDNPEFCEQYSYEVLTRDREIASVLNFLTYCSPDDDVDVFVPELPISEAHEMDSEESGLIGGLSKPKISHDMATAIKRRRQALKKRREQLQKAWANWQKPVLKPGDFVVLLRPCPTFRTSTLLTTVDKNARICIVHRFWCENEERSRHLFWIHGGIDICTSTSSPYVSIREKCSPPFVSSNRLYMHVRSLHLIEQHSGDRGPQSQRPVSSVGVLDNGEEYFIYRFILFWDGFQIHKGKSSSGDGLYMHCLNLPIRSKASSSSVRILSQTPPGVNIATVLHRILPDIVQGMTTGFLDYDADGKQRRIFLDLVGFLGDTPALNSTLDVLGHTALVFCHLCRFKRLSSTLIGSRYTSTASHGNRSAYRRGFFQHSALYDCGAKSATCRQMGIRSTLPAIALPLHAYRKAFQDARTKVPTAGGGHTLLPCQLDPYRAAFIAPDHLLSSHLRDCISLVLKLLPSKDHRILSEKFMISLLKEVGLPAQNRLVDHDKRTLLSMSMTELYALSIVSEQAFLRGCRAVPEAKTNSLPLSAKCKEAIALVGSTSKLIAELWLNQDEQVDGTRALQEFHGSNGWGHVRKARSSVLLHIENVESICRMDDRDNEALQDPRCPKELRAKLTKLQRECLIAIKTVDKPNVHRLFELVCTTLPMIGHVAFIGELVLEKAHQSLKRALIQSNNKDFQITSMKSIAFDDWQGRLSLIASNVLKEDEPSLLSCFRLLAGREAVASLNGKLEASQKTAVIRTMGPQRCVHTELKRQGKSVISPRDSHNYELRWQLIGKVHTLNCGATTYEPFTEALLQCIRNAFLIQLHHRVVSFAIGIKSTLPNGIYDRSFLRGDVVETLCYQPYDPEFHFPFLVQTNVSNYIRHFSTNIGRSLWCVIAAIYFKNENKKGQFYVALRPCLPVQGPDFNNDKYYFRRYRVDTEKQISFAMLDASMRKVGTMHECPVNDCIKGITAGASSSCTPLYISGGVFQAITRTDGFPPRQG